MIGKTPSRYAVALLLLFATACSHSPEPQGGPSQLSAVRTRHVTFVQWTDPHVFDAGKGRTGEGVREEELDNWAAFHWAVLQTNRMVLTEHRDIDFVVITGDFGLENVLLSNETKRTSCPGDKPSQEGPIPTVPIAAAADEVARELDALLVKRVYLVPGNNDLACESPKDLPRWTQFVTALQQDLADRDQNRNKAANMPKKPNTATAVEVVDLTSIADAPVINGISLLGLDSAYFKDHEIDRNKKKPATVNSAGKLAITKDIDPASKLIQNDADAAIPKEIERISKQIQPGGSYLVFTHVPDLNDPIGRSPAWKLSVKESRNWKNNVLDESAVLGVFAGHFHIAKRDMYPQNFPDKDKIADANTAVKVWLAPPLAEKYQWRSPPEETARGMLLVSVNADGQTRVSAIDGDVKASAMWFSTSDQNTAAVSVGDDKIAQAREAERDRNWSDAATQYQAVLSQDKADPRTRATALSGYLHARGEMRSWWWKSTAARWIYLNGMSLLVTVGIVVGAIVVCAMLRWFYVVKGASIFLKFVFVPGFEGRATINDTAAMTDSAPVKLFASMLRAEGQEIRSLLQREQEHWAAGHITLLAPANTSLDSLVASVPKVGSGPADLSVWTKFLVNLLQVLRWTVQTGLAVFPPNQLPPPTAPPAGANAPVIVTGAELNAYAVLQWAWVTKRSWWRMRTVGNDLSALRDLARELAALICGEAFV